MTSNSPFRAAAVAVTALALVVSGGSLAMAAPATTTPKPAADFHTSFETGDAQPTPTPIGTPTHLADFTAKTGAGPTEGPNMKSGAGFTGTRSLSYGGSQSAAAASGTTVLFADQSLRLGTRTQLSYKVFPELGADLQYPATYVSVDLELSDGTRVSDASYGLVDGHGDGISAAAQGTSKILYADQWNSVKIDLGSLAGKTVTKVLLSYSNPAGTSKTEFAGWVDDIAVANAPKAATGAGLVSYVDTRRGTNSSGSFSRGNNFPAAAVPNGFNFWTPMTDASSQTWLYDYASTNDAKNLPTLEGIGVSHEPSPWMGDRNQLAFLPSAQTGTPDATLKTRALEFRHDDETARPDLYSVKFTDGITAEVTPTDHAAVMRFGFTGSTGSVLVDRVAGTSGLTVADDGTVSGWVDGGSGLSAGASRMFVSGRFDRAPLASGAAAGDRTSAKYARFDTSSDKSVVLRVATSFISAAQAAKNLQQEVGSRSFATVHAAAQKAWNDRLSVITLGGATADQLATTYGSLYRLNMYPNSQFENTGTVAKPVYKYASPVAATVGDATATTTNAVVKPGKVYVNNGFWDTYRTAWPAYSMLYPKLAGELMDGFVQQYKDAGWIARWSSPGYADLMTGTSSDVAFADAYLKGASTKDALSAYDAALKNATVLSPISGTGRKGLDTSIFLGYTPSSTGESVSWALEGYINDYGIGRMAAKLAKDPAVPAARKPQLREESAYFLEQAKHYVELFDPSIGFFQAKNADGSFQQAAKDYDPGSWGGAYTETDGWNFAFHAPFDVQGLASLYGGDAGLVKKLDEFFATPEKADKPGGYGGTIHEMLEARDVRMGQLGMSNQPSHHIPYLYAAAGAPSKTQAAVREITRRLFVGSDIGQGYPGDEDNGEMSSWFLFSALGFYPLALASDSYEIGSPLFTHAVVSPIGGNRLTIDAPANSTKNVYVKGATLNGKALSSATLSAALVAKGGALRFDMSATPSNWGAGSAPTEPTPVPLVDAAGSGTVTSNDGVDVTALTDDNSRSSVEFATSDPAITFDSDEGPATVDSYTLTNGADGDSPTSWKLEGSSDGKTWVTVDKRSAQTWPWQTQTRPFEIAKPRALLHYRLTVTGTTTGAAPTLSEVELLTDTTATQAGYTVSPKASAKTEVGRFDGPVASVAGSTAATSTATVDFLDGKGPQTATLTKSKLGSYDIAASHMFAKPGAYSVLVTATDGTRMASTTATITVSRTAPSLTGAYDSTCLATDGHGGNCDGLGNAFSAASLAESGFVQGETNEVAGTALTFDLPDVAPGQADNATGAGQVIPLSLGDDVTQLSVIGTANEKAQDTVGTLTFDDGSTADMPIQFGDWTAAAAKPQFGNTVVATSKGRYDGGAPGDDAVAAIYATAPFTLPEGKKAVSLTLPVQTGAVTSTGRIHVFAVATDGTREAVPALSVKAGASIQARAGVSVKQALATVAGGASESYAATVNWGDGSATADAAVADGTVTGSHTYAAPGTYTVTVTADDGTGSATTTLKAVITKATVAYAPTLTARATTPGGIVTVRGAGFAPGERVKLTVSGLKLATTATASATGAFVLSGTVPKKATAGTYPVIATGVKSGVPATVDVTVE
ncbi:putative alpha-1,2-mannosidase [Frondihabitans sp. PhB188]|uniref:GH92 family glycosyl hydrolase n=1 Tax=Frondihabitans sp. PhB188 TaxID=2485200 RepID=UPI000FB9C238|nr:GH92 family glycosyl hydrolase [Frondihabitans sp. PhB188]ROQ40042.1 putative alpha-1,2-mannosidase [Frondihabitans sp. PhB188]